MMSQISDASNQEIIPLHTLNPTERFSERVEDYAKFRPSYPPAAIEIILKKFKHKSNVTAADIGAGTGIASHLLAESGVKVIAIEPNVEMRTKAATHPLIDYRDGSAEFTKLADKSVHLVTCFQAFHWFEPCVSLREFQRVLKPSGQLALVWNNRDRTDAFTNAYSQIIHRASHHHPAESRSSSIQPLYDCGEFTKIRTYEFPYYQLLTLSGLIGRAMSTSYLPKQGEAHKQLITELQQLYQEFCDANNNVSMLYQTLVHLAEPK